MYGPVDGYRADGGLRAGAVGVRVGEVQVMMIADGLLLTCRRCAGKGRIEVRPVGEVTCPDCAGRGRVISTAGKRVLELVQFAITTGALDLAADMERTDVGPAYPSSRWAG
jgi:hypothetical protein